jgi:hypothetical protein
MGDTFGCVHPSFRYKVLTAIDSGWLTALSLLVSAGQSIYFAANRPAPRHFFRGKTTKHNFAASKDAASWVCPGPSRKKLIGDTYRL